MNRQMAVLSLIKSGGTMVESSGPTYAEAGASVPAGRSRVTKVDSIQIVKLNTPLNIVSMPLVR